ncbi:hypothetical protein KC963_02180 [Candidatus Saccharibacteria bacterium]|nr:hypothetical protein [Candidatus Saccharibacteria bacterium]MCA9337568.1 hypothetical protein [Candidatus Saccharibacteria bacterium]
MENKGFSPAEDDKKDEAVWQRGLHAISEWWNEHFGEPEEDDDDEAEDAPKRRRKIAGRYFAAQVVGRLFGRQDIKGESDAEATEETDPDERNLLPIVPLGFDVLRTEPEPAFATLDESVILEQSPTPEQLEDQVTAPNTEPQTSEAVPEEQQQPVLRDWQETSPDIGQQAAGETEEDISTAAVELDQNYQMGQTTEKEKSHAPRQINAVGPALISGIIVDQMSRHRDRQLRKGAEELRKKLQQSDKQQREMHDQIESMQAKQYRQEQEQIKYTEPATGQEPHIPAERVVVRETVAPTSTRVEAENIPGVRPEKAHYTEEASQTQGKAEVATKNPLEAKVDDPNARLVLEQAEAAAEHDIPLESYYERRHEAKDEPNQQGTHHSRTSGISFGASSPKDQHIVLPSTPADTSQLSDVRSKKDIPSDMYKTAVVSGLVTSAVIGACLLVYLLLR